MTKTKRRELTAHERDCAKRINKLWQDKKRDEKLSQPDAAEALKMTTSGFNQYINGKIPLNTDATFRFARYFGVDPRRIDPQWLGGEENSSPKRITEPAAEYEALLEITTKEQDLTSITEIIGRVSPKDALRIARLFLDRAEAGL